MFSFIVAVLFAISSTIFLNFCMLRVYTLPHIFYYTKAILMKRVHRNNSPTTTAFGLHHTVALNNSGKMRICKKHRTFEAIEKKLG